MREVYINKIAAFFPNEAVDNDNIENVLGMVDGNPSLVKRIVLKSNKIKTRYYAIDPQTGETTHSNAQMAAEAIKNLQKDGFDTDSTELLVCGTTTPDQLLPGHALMVHGETDLSPMEVLSVAGICLSGLSALKYAYISIKAGEVQSAITTGSENVSASMRGRNFEPEVQSKVEMVKRNKELTFEKDFLRWMLSDGAGAIGVSNKPNSDSLSLKINRIFVRSYASQMETCMYSGCEKLKDGTTRGYREYLPEEWLTKSIFAVKQDVKLLNDNVLYYTVYKPLEEMLEHNMFKPEEIDWFLPHYSSGYFRDKLYEMIKKVGCDIPQEKWFTNLATKGNTGSASIYIILEELFSSGMLKKGEKLLCYIPESGRFSTSFMLLEVV
ncbi:MAG: 3-oxoacyl-ACP synthase [Epsilonproteobacteria bacterium (ex Lamellibrachia satsuma)]|nr:MAG: 3-oxoacyl-ACP synthase [Epsilonproteobacteria bacterium (ex Lamellibrachia satsuma)]